VPTAEACAAPISLVSGHQQEQQRLRGLRSGRRASRAFRSAAAARAQSCLRLGRNCADLVTCAFPPAGGAPLLGRCGDGPGFKRSDRGLVVPWWKPPANASRNERVPLDQESRIAALSLEGEAPPRFGHRAAERSRGVGRGPVVHPGHRLTVVGRVTFNRLEGHGEGGSRRFSNGCRHGGRTAR
jgi:hypothetical protein